VPDQRQVLLDQFLYCGSVLCSHRSPFPLRNPVQRVIGCLRAVPPRT
jgi:hypothetical protein